MSEPFLGEIRMFAGTFAPYHWAFCDGQIVGISTNQALASLLGGIYAGDGINTFGLPDMRGRIPVHFGQSGNLTNRAIGSRYGVESVGLTEAQIPAHMHVLYASSEGAVDTDPADNVPAVTTPAFYSQGGTSDMVANFPDTVMGYTGNGEKHFNMMPSLVLNFIIALRGVYPSKN